MYRGRHGFILPYAMLLASAILVLAILLARQRQHADGNHEVRQIHNEARHTVRTQVRPLVDFLESIVLASTGCSAWEPVDGSGTAFRTIQLVPEKEPVVLGSLSPDGEGVAFQSVFAEAEIQAGLIALPSPDDQRSLSVAWCAEDISLSNAPGEAKQFWPLPRWDLAPWQPEDPPVPFLDRLAGDESPQTLWIPDDQDLPFSPGLSPALVPVARAIRLSFGIFASGPVKSREKTLRLRYHLEIDLWNPYNRTLRIHEGSGQRPVFQCAIWNFPDIRIHNLTTGSSTGWISPDMAENPATGKSGIHAWIELPATIAEGESIQLMEPDPSHQPEGLARVLHPGFMAGPGDRMEIEWKEPIGSLSVAFLPVEETRTMESAIDGKGWFRIEGLPMAFPKLEISRADSGQHPFYLHGGSLSYRISGAHYRLSMESAFDPEHPERDPRRSRIVFSNTFADASGEPADGSDLFRGSSTLTPEADPLPTGTLPFALFSWPESEPENILEASDLPAWSEGYRIGSKGAARINRILDEDWSWSGDGVQLPLATGEMLNFRQVFPVNCPHPDGWTTVLDGSPSGLPLYPNPVHEAHVTAPLDPGQIARAAVFLAGQSQLAPVDSVSRFFTNGYLAEAIPQPEVPRGLHLLMPLRGWLRGTPVPRRHGPAWILHLAVRAGHESFNTWKSARVWLLETGRDQRFEVIRFEWTNPASHLIGRPH